MLRLSKLADYGVVLMAELARDAAGSTQNARELAERTNLPFPMVGKVLKALARGGLLVSHRGSKGGYGLVRPATQISVAKVIAALEGPVALTECGAAPGVCEHEPSCHVRTPMERVTAVVAESLERVTLADLIHPSDIIPLEELGVH